MGGSTLDLDPTLDPYLCCTFWPELSSRGGGPLQIQLQSHFCPAWADCGGSTPDPDPYLCCTFWPEFRGREGVHSSSSPISVQPELIVGDQLQKNLESTPLFCLQKSFCCTWLGSLIAFRWPMSQKGRWHQYFLHFEHDVVLSLISPAPP